MRRITFMVKEGQQHLRPEATAKRGILEHEDLEMHGKNLVQTHGIDHKMPTSSP